MPVANELSPLLVPEPKRKGLEAGKQRYWLNGLKERFGLVALLQIIVGNARAQMMNVMKPDIA